LFIGRVKRRMRAPMNFWSKQVVEAACIWLKEPKSAPQGLKPVLILRKLRQDF
jgi:hypothetical protein